eukprot:1142856_1
MASGDIIPGDSIARFKLDREKAQAEASAKKAKEAKKSSKKKRKAAKKSVPKKKKRAAQKGAKGKKKGGKKKGSKKGPGSDTTSMHNDEDISNSDIILLSSKLWRDVASRAPLLGEAAAEEPVAATGTIRQQPVGCRADETRNCSTDYRS